jgi:hypothetical protein
MSAAGEDRLRLAVLRVTTTHGIGAALAVLFVARRGIDYGARDLKPVGFDGVIR